MDGNRRLILFATTVEQHTDKSLKKIQPPIMPRPDIASLGIKYRRIPVLSIGRDVYLDTRLILQKLEALPAPPGGAPPLGASTSDGDRRALQRLLGVLTNEAGPFVWAATLLPAHLPVFKDEAWIRDRTGFFFPGAKVGAASPQTRAEAAADLRGLLELLETALLADGRDWVLGTDAPALADIEAVWLLHWLRGIPGALPADQLSERQFPRTFAWVERFDGAVAAARKRLGRVPVLSGEQAAAAIVGSPYHEEAAQVARAEPIVQVLGLKQGDRVVVYPTDSGSSHKDSGSLVGLDDKEVVFETKAELQGSPAVRVHAPRHGFRVVREGQGSRL